MSRDNKVSPGVVLGVLLGILLPTGARAQSADVAVRPLAGVSRLAAGLATLRLRESASQQTLLLSARPEPTKLLKAPIPVGSAGKSRVLKVVLGAAIGGGLGYYTGVQMRKEYAADSHASFGPAIVLGGVGAGLGALIAYSLTKH